MVDIFDEVEEELRAERTQRLFRKYGPLLVAAALLVVLGVGGWQGWRWWQGRQDTAVASQYVGAMNVADSAGTDKAKQETAIKAFADIARKAPEGYRTLARLQEAALKAQTGDISGASKLWDTVASDRSAPPLLRDLASLLWAQHQIDTANPGMLRARLKALTTPDNAWSALAQEQLAVLDLREGKKDAAKKQLTQLAQDITAPNGVRARAAGLLAQLGG